MKPQWRTSERLRCVSALAAAVLAAAALVLYARGCSGGRSGQKNGTADANEHPLVLASEALNKRASPADASKGAYTTMEIEDDPNGRVWNGQSYPVDDKDKKIYLQHVYISGAEVEMDPSKAPFDSLITKANTSSITIEADKIIVRGKQTYPQTDLKLVAQEIVFEQNASIDLTPKDYPLAADPYSAAGNTPAGPGHKGGNGAHVWIYTNDLQLQATQNILLAKGGKGQRGGEGQTGGNGTDMTPILTGSYAAAVPGGYSSVLLPNPITYAANCDGHRDDYCLGIRCGETNWSNPQKGTPAHPTNGDDAQVGGAPGAGGDGGSIIYIGPTNPSLSSKSLFSVQPGLIGDVPGSAIGHCLGYKGGIAGQPVTTSWLSCVDWGSPNAHYVVDNTVSTSAGTDKCSPTNPTELTKNGEVKINSIPPQQNNFAAAYSKRFYIAKLKLIRDQYLAQNFKWVQLELIRVSQLLDITKSHYNSVKEFPTNTVTDLSHLQSRLAVLLTQINQQEDYFGDSVYGAPLYNLDFSVNQFDAEVKVQVRKYLFSTHILNKIKERQLVMADLKLMSQSYDAIVDQEAANTLAYTEKVNSLQSSLDSLQAQDTMYNRQLMDLEKQIEALAQKNAGYRNRGKELRQKVKVLAAIAKVIPAYQPALAAAGSLAEHLADIPEEGSAMDYIAALQKVKGDFDALKDDKTIAASRKSMNAFLNDLKASNIRDKDVAKQLEYLKELAEKYKPAVEKVNELSKGFNKSVVSDAEIQAEVQRIKDSDPVFTSVTTGLQVLLKEKANQLEAFKQVQKDLLISRTVLYNNIVLAIGSRTSLAEKSTTSLADSFVKSFVEQIFDDSEDRLMYLYNSVLRSYSYTVLEQPQIESLALMKEKVLDILKTNKNMEEVQTVMQAFYRSFIDKLILNLDNKFHKGSPELLIRNGSVVVPLDKEQMRQLNKDGITTVALTTRMYSKEQSNIRIDSITLRDVRFSNKSEDRKCPELVCSVSVDVAHSGDGVIRGRNDKSFSYVYPNAERLFSWGSGFQVMDNKEIIESKHEMNNSVKGILSLLIKDNSNALMSSPIFAQPAGITKLIVRKVNNNIRLPLEQLRLDVHYTYSKY